MKHNCEEFMKPWVNGVVVFKKNLWWFIAGDHGNLGGPISFCPFCGEKLPFDPKDLELYAISFWNVRRLLFEMGGTEP